MSYTYPYPRPALTVDAIIFKVHQGTDVLLIQRDIAPFEGAWALPGGYVQMDETLEEAAARELREETGLRNIDLYQVKAFGAPDRDPRGRTISVAFWGILKDKQQIVAGDDARNAAWFPINQLPALAFDHQAIIACTLEKAIGFLT